VAVSAKRTLFGVLVLLVGSVAVVSVFVTGTVRIMLLSLLLLNNDRDNDDAVAELAKVDKEDAEDDADIRPTDDPDADDEGSSPNEEDRRRLRLWRTE